eukprot:gene14101-14227_t
MLPPFKQWYQQHYGAELGQKKGEEKTEAAETKVRREQRLVRGVASVGQLAAAAAAAAG